MASVNATLESMFDAEMTSDKLLDKVRENVAKSVTTIEAAALLENKMSEEAAQFNDCLTSIDNAIQRCKRHEITAEEAKTEIAPFVDALKKRCAAIGLADTEIKDDDITEEEIAMLREFIVGCKDIVADRKAELQDSPIPEETSDEVEKEVESAEEGLFDTTGLDEMTARRVKTYESLVNTLEAEIAIEAALEATGEGEADDSALARYKASMAEYKKATKAGDATAAEKARKDIDKAIADLKAEGKNAKTPEEKEAFARKLKIVGGIAAGLAAVGGTLFGLAKYSKHAHGKIDEATASRDTAMNQSQKDIEAANKTLQSYERPLQAAMIKGGDQVLSLATKVVDTVDSTRKKVSNKFSKAPSAEAQGEPVGESVLTALLEADGVCPICGEAECKCSGNAEPIEGKAFDDDDKIEDAIVGDDAEVTSDEDKEDKEKKEEEEAVEAFKAFRKYFMK